MKKLVLGLILTFFASFVSANVSVITHAGVQSVDQDTVKKLYLGKTKALPSGDKAELFILNGDSVSTQFTETLLGRNESQFSAYWSKMLFTGRGVPPTEVGSIAEMIEKVSSTPGAVGFVPSTDVSGDVKVAFEL